MLDEPVTLFFGGFRGVMAPGWPKIGDAAGLGQGNVLKETPKGSYFGLRKCAKSIQSCDVEMLFQPAL